jgi:hypothetical protein
MLALWILATFPVAEQGLTQDRGVTLLANRALPHAMGSAGSLGRASGLWCENAA